MKYSGWVFLFMMQLLFSCSDRSGKALILGEISNADGELLVLQELSTKDIRNLDSVKLHGNGRFSFRISPLETGFYMLKAPSGKVLVMMIGKGDTIQLKGGFSDFPDQVVLTGNKEATLLHDFFVFTRKNEKEVDSLEMLLVEKQDSSGYYQLTQRIDTAFQKIWERQKAYEENFITRNPHSLASLIVLNYAFGMSPVISPDEDFSYYLILDRTLPEVYPGNKHVVYHQQRVKEHQRQKELEKIKK